MLPMVLDKAPVDKCYKNVETYAENLVYHTFSRSSHMKYPAEKNRELRFAVR